MPLLADPTLVVSPHLDDAVLSLGASIARTTRAGRHVTVLTVFAGNTESALAAGGWDGRGGFATEGEASRARRLEDQEACRGLGAEPLWLSFSEADYRDGLDGEAIWSAVTAAVTDARPEDVLLPGFPLTNPDHAWIGDLLSERSLPCRRVGLYAEQPYRYASAPRALGDEWLRTGRDPRDVWRKRRATLAYTSQLPLLGLSQRRYLKLNRMLIHERLRGGEAIKWIRS